MYKAQLKKKRKKQRDEISRMLGKKKKEEDMLYVLHNLERISRRSHNDHVKNNNKLSDPRTK